MQELTFIAERLNYKGRALWVSLETLTASVAFWLTGTLKF